jgi:iron complex transport system permease protein
MSLPPARFALALGLGGIALALLAAWSLTVGRFPVAAADVWRALWSALVHGGSTAASNADAVVVEVRAPRVAAALAVGAALSGAGAAFQALFRNPLVSPDILGVSSGCALGAGIAVLLALPAAATQAFAFAGGIAAVALVVAIASRVGERDPLLTLILAGVVVGTLFGAGIALVKIVADPYNQLPAITFWLLGSFAGAAPRDLAVAAVPLVAGLVPLHLLRSRIDLLALSEDEARSLGVHVGRLRMAVIVAATLVTAAAVAVAGTIGWIGLLVPHAARMLAGAPFARVFPLALVLGAGFMLVVDTLCRSLFASEIPPGVVTALVGAPVFIGLLAATFRRAP